MGENGLCLELSGQNKQERLSGTISAGINGGERMREPILISMPNGYTAARPRFNLRNQKLTQDEKSPKWTSEPARI